MKAPLGWDNSTEMQAATVDALNALLRLTYNANSEQPNRDPLPTVPRPYLGEQSNEPQTISADELNDILRG